MLILGIDPGTVRIGYALIRKTRKALKLVNCGVFTSSAKDTPTRLVCLAKNIKKTLKEFSPALVAVERIFFFKNKKTAFEIAQAIGVLSLISTQLKINQVHYTPLEIKQTIVGYGLADKEEVAERVLKILKLKKFKGLDDASDALAVALTAICRLHQYNQYKNKKQK